MLTALRGAMGGWVAKIFLVLLVASFAVWGVSGSMFSGTGNATVTVGETRVSLLDYRLAYDRQINLIQRQLGQRITREQAEAFGAGELTLSQVVTGAILDETAREMGLGLSDDKLAGLIGEDEAFRDGSGRFSRSQLQAVLRSIGMREEDYVQSRKQVAIRTQILEGTASDAQLPDAYWDVLSAYQAEQRVFDYVLVSEADLEALPEASQSDLEAFYEETLSDYLAPEYRKLAIVKLEAGDIADAAALPAEDVRAAYEDRADEYTSPERRTIDQLVFPSREEAQAAATKLSAGTTFDELVSEQGKAPGDVELGTFARGEIPDTGLAEAAFQLGAGETSGVVDGLFGSVILRVRSIEPESTQAFEEVEAQLREELALVRAAERIFDTHDMVEDERAAGETLARAAEVAGLQLRLIEAVDRNARDPQGNVITDIPQSREVLAEAFDTEVGVEVDPLSIGTDGFVWYEVLDVTPERQKSFEEVREEVLAAWNALQVAEALDGLAEELQKRAEQNGGLEAAARELLSVPVSDGNAASATGEGGEAGAAETAEPASRVKTSVAFTRSESSNDLSNQAVRAGFSVARGGIAVAPGSQDGVLAVLQVADVLDGVKLPVENNVRAEFNRQHSDDMITQMIAKMQETREVEINRQAINAAISR